MLNTVQKTHEFKANLYSFQIGNKWTFINFKKGILSVYQLELGNITKIIYNYYKYMCVFQFIVHYRILAFTHIEYFAWVCICAPCANLLCASADIRRNVSNAVKDSTALDMWLLQVLPPQSLTLLTLSCWLGFQFQARILCLQWGLRSNQRVVGFHLGVSATHALRVIEPCWSLVWFIGAVAVQDSWLLLSFTGLHGTFLY